MSQLFTVAGTSTLPVGGTKVRYANDMTRVKVLVKGGHENIDLIELPNAMTKEDIVAYLIKIDFADGNADKQAAINAEAVKRRVGEAVAPTATKAKAKANVTVTPKVKAKAEPKRKVVPRPEIPYSKDLEDAPF
jgi:hypothetical protein